MPPKPKPKPNPPVHLDGTTLEGGGQLLRLATGLSALTKVPIHITSIRGKRAGGGGLKAQHLTGVQWLGRASSARVSGLGLKSKEIVFVPAVEMGMGMRAEGLEMEVKQSTPGSVNLVFQAVLPYILFSLSGSKLDAHSESSTANPDPDPLPVTLRITGGTNVSNSPSSEYVAQVLLPMLEALGIPKIHMAVQSRGWSMGSARVGAVAFTITPLRAALPAFRLVERGRVVHVRATIIAPAHAEQDIRDELDVMFERRHAAFFGGADADGDTDVTFEDSRHEKRYYLLLVATTSTGVKLGRDWLYDGGIRAGKGEKVVAELVGKVGADLAREIAHGGCVDEFLRDQLVVFQALAEGRSEVDGGMVAGKGVRPSLHARTTHWVVQRLLGVEFDEGGGCEGVGFVPGEGIKEKGDGDGVGGLAEQVQDLTLGNAERS